MPRQMPRLAGEFHTKVVASVSLARAGELIRAHFGANDPYRNELSVSRLEAIYELAFLRIFIDWEIFLEESFVRYLCGYVNASFTGSLNQAPSRTVADARML